MLQYNMQTRKMKLLGNPKIYGVVSFFLFHDFYLQYHFKYNWIVVWTPYFNKFHIFKPTSRREVKA